MSTALYEETKKDIDEAYRSKNAYKIEKETNFILDRLIVTMMSNFKDRVKGVSIDEWEVNPYIFTEKNQMSLYSWLNRFKKIETPISDLEFGKLKVDLENWYYQIGGKEITFSYTDSYLITPGQAAGKLGISRVTLNKYIKHGFECVDTRGHNKIPKHAAELWKDPVYAIKMQMLAQKKKIQNQTIEERIKDINDELLEFQKKYKSKNFQEAFIGYDLETADDPSEYFEWRDLVEEKELLLTKLIGENSFAPE